VSEMRTRRPTARARFGVLVAAFSTAFAWAAIAQAGYAIQPASGTTSAPQPTFLVYLDSQDSFGEVYVAATPQLDSSGFPAEELGSCLPTTPFGETNKYTCAPSFYSSSSTSSLPPGTYYWWLTFYRTDPGNFVPTLHISGPLSFTVPQPVQPADTYLVSPAMARQCLRHPRSRSRHPMPQRSSSTSQTATSASLMIRLPEQHFKVAQGRPRERTPTTARLIPAS
jgi:hypothetical protein